MGSLRRTSRPSTITALPKKAKQQQQQQQQQQRQQQQNYKNSLPRPSHPAKLTLSERKIYQYHYERFTDFLRCCGAGCPIV